MSSADFTTVDADSSAKPNTTTTTPHKGSTITPIETRTDLSTYFRLIRAFMRPLRPHLAGIKPLNITGSPRFTKHPTSAYGVTISERMILIPNTTAHPLTQPDEATNTQKLWLYDMIPPSLPRGKTPDSSDIWWTHTIYYFAGGGFQAPPSTEHWKLTARLAKDLAPLRIRVTMLSYPMAPNSPAKDSLPLLRAWLAHSLSPSPPSSSFRFPTETISLIGDSAGGNIVLSLAFWWSQSLQAMHTSNTSESSITAWHSLTNIVAISPPCDFRNVNPDIEIADRHDPVLTASITGGAADAWCADWEGSPLTLSLSSSQDGTIKPPSDPLNASPHATKHPNGGTSHPAKSDPTLSPLLQSSQAWSALRTSTIPIHGIIGTADRLGPDGLLFMKRCVEERIRGRWLVWEGQMHCFPILVAYAVREGREGYGFLRGVVEGEVKGEEKEDR